MATIAEALQQRGYTIAEADVAQALLDLLPEAPTLGAAALTTTERDLLSAGGLTVTPGRAALRRAGARTAAAYTALIAESFTAAEVALRLGRDRSTVQRVISAGALYAVRVAGQHRLPAFQFDIDGRPLPGLEQVLHALPDGLNPLTVEGFFTTPDPDLPDDQDHPLSPAQWLATGGDPQAAARLAADLQRH